MSLGQCTEDAFHVGTCTGIAGDNITIPCGMGVMEDGSTMFLYFIAKVPNEPVILANNTMFLQKSLAIDNNGVEITCIPGDSSPSTSYTLNVLCEVQFQSLYIL